MLKASRARTGAKTRVLIVMRPAIYSVEGGRLAAPRGANSSRTTARLWKLALGQPYVFSEWRLMLETGTRISPPVGLGLFATCSITGTEIHQVIRPMMKYLAVLFLALLALVFVPAFSLWLPARFGF